VRLVNDVHAIAAFAGSVGDFVAQVANVVDAAVGGRVDLNQVERPTVQRRATQRAGVARVAVFSMLAVDGAVQDAGDRRLARAAGTREEVGVCRPLEFDGVAQRAGDVLLADDVFKAERAPLQIEGAMRLSFGSCLREIFEHAGR
jgi:hypothetical protein